MLSILDEHPCKSEGEIGLKQARLFAHDREIPLAREEALRSYMSWTQTLGSIYSGVSISNTISGTERNPNGWNSKTRITILPPKGRPGFWPAKDFWTDFCQYFGAPCTWIGMLLLVQWTASKPGNVHTQNDDKLEGRTATLRTRGQRPALYLPPRNAPSKKWGKKR